MRGKIKPHFAFFVIIIAFVLSMSVSSVTGNGYLTVYITATGGRYHSDGCGSLSRSKYEITLEEAIVEGYTPCDRCNPPVYTGDAVPYETREVHSGGSSSSHNNKSSRENPAISSKEYDDSEQYQEWSVKKIKPSSGEIIGYVLLALVMGPVAFELVFSLILYPLWRLVVCLYNLLPWVKKKKEKKRQEEQRLKELEEQKKRKQIISDLFYESDKQKQIFLSALTAFTQRCTDIKIPKADLNQDKKRLDVLLKSNFAYVKNGMICKKDGEVYGKSCTVYYSYRGNCYHLSTCHSAGDYSCHILHPPSGYYPCSRCRPDKVDIEWMREAERILKKIAATEAACNLLEQCKSEKISAIKEKCEKKSKQIFTLSGEKVRFIDNPLSK